MRTLKLSEIEIDLVRVMQVWESNKTITRNMENVINDFNFMHQNAEVFVHNLDVDLEQAKDIKVKLINAHICGILSAVSPQSAFNSKHILENFKSFEESEKDRKSEEFKKSILL